MRVSTQGSAAASSSTGSTTSTTALAVMSLTDVTVLMTAPIATPNRLTIL
jgi:hypothetical protein